MQHFMRDAESSRGQRRGHRGGATLPAALALALAISTCWASAARAAADEPAASKAAPQDKAAEKPLTEQFDQRDADKNGRLTRDEYIAPVAEENRPARLRDFVVFDDNADGELTRAEFLCIASLAGPHERGPLPDPLETLVARRMAEIEKNWPAWDKNRDNRLTPDEFETAGLRAAAPGLEQTAFRDWDLIGDGGLTLADCRPVLEAAYGIKRLTGEPLRLPSGAVIDWNLFLEIDYDGNDRLDWAEYQRNRVDGKQAEQKFKETDTDHDGRVTFAEWSRARPIDSPARYLQMDTNLDGKLDRGELLNTPWKWQLEMSQFVLPAFDDDGDEKLSLTEYMLSPLAHRQVRWQEPRTDADNDGALSPEEFRWARRVESAAQAAEYFLRFDRNHDGRLDQTEYFMKTPRRDLRTAFARRDANKDGRLSLDEFNLASGDKAPAARNFRLFDLDGDGSLTYDEFLLDPASVPREFRGPIGDPIYALVDRQMNSLTPQWKASDRNGDGALTRDEFESGAIGRSSPELAMLEWQEFDRNGDGRVTEAECRAMIEVAYGVRRMTGEPLREKSGFTVTSGVFDRIDRNGDDSISRPEYAEFAHEPPDVAEQRFQESDRDKDGEITFAEWWGTPSRWVDTVNRFLPFDVNFDGQIDRDELAQQAQPWQRGLARTAFPAFDANRDGFLSLAEFLGSTLLFPVVEWNNDRDDRDFDGKLELSEFHWGRRGIELRGVEREFFTRLDVNQDGGLDLDEFDFRVNARRAPREVVFKRFDKDRNGRVTIDEALKNVRRDPPPKHDRGYETQLARAEDAFRQADANHDDALTLDEFATEEALAAVAPGSGDNRPKPVGPGAETAAGAAWLEEWRTWLIVGLNVVIVGGVLVYIVRKA